MSDEKYTCPRCGTKMHWNGHFIQNSNEELLYEYECRNIDCRYSKYKQSNEEENNEELVNKIANYFEKDDNWRKLKECWMYNGRSEDFRRLLKEALK